MNEYVEKMIKDKFLLEIITTAFYDYDTPVEVLHPDLAYSNEFDLILSCGREIGSENIKVCKYIRFIYQSNKAEQENPIKSKWAKTQNNKTIITSENIANIVQGQDAIAVDGPTSLNHPILGPIPICRIVLTYNYDSLEINGYEINGINKSFDDLLKELFGLDKNTNLNIANENEKKHEFEKSTLMEQFGTRTFVKEIRETAWLKFGNKEIMVLRGEVDAFGYDLVLICNNKTRYIQLKSTNKNKKPQPVNINLSKIKGGCVVWQKKNEVGTNWKEIWNCGYRFLGGKSDECLNFLWVCKMKESSNQENKEKINQIKKQMEDLQKEIDKPDLPTDRKDDFRKTKDKLNVEKTDLENNRKTKFNKSKREVKFAYLCDLSKSCKPVPISCKLLDFLKITCMISREILKQSDKDEENRIDVLEFYKVSKLKNKTIYRNDKNDPHTPMINLISILFDIYPTGTH